MNYAKMLLTKANENSITTKNLAAILKVCPLTINNWIKGSNTSYGRYKLYNEKLTAYILNRKAKEDSTRNIEDYKYDFLMQMLNKVGKTDYARSRFLEIPRGTIWNWVNKRYFPKTSKLIEVAEKTNTPLPEWLSESKQLSFEDIEDSFSSSVCEDSGLHAAKHSFNLTFSEDEIDTLFDCLHLERITGKNVPNFYNFETDSYSINNELVQYIVHDWIATKFTYYKDKLKGV